MTRAKRRLPRVLARLSTVLILLLLACSPAMAGKDKTITFGDLSWDTAQVHNRVAGFIIEKGMGYTPEYIPGSSAILFQALTKGEVNVNMESWTNNLLDLYTKALKEKTIVDLGPNFLDAKEAWYVPTYMIKGDPARGIKPMAPGLKSVSDLPKYWKLFKDPEDPDKGRIFIGITGWKVTGHTEKKVKAYGLDKTYNPFITGSDAALAGSMVAAYKKGKPWLGYYWAPTWVMGKLDMTALEEPAFDQEVWDATKGCAYPKPIVNILVNSELPKRAPDVVAMLDNYATTLDQNNKMMAFMEDSKSDVNETAVWFLKTYEDTWTKWVSPVVAAKVKAALK